MAKTAQKSPAKRVQLQARRDDVITLALGGLSLRDIADQIADKHGRVSHITVANDIKARLEEAAADNEDVSRLRALQIRRFERLLRSWWLRAQTEPQALDRVVTILTKMAKYTGIEAPKKIAIGGDPDAPPVKVDTAVRDIDSGLKKLSIEQLGQLRLIRDAMKDDEGHGSKAA